MKWIGCHSQDRGLLEDLYIDKLIQDTGRRRDYNGIDFYASYGIYPPYCDVVKNGSEVKVIGLFPETLRAFGDFANLTIHIDLPQPENENVWGIQ